MTARTENLLKIRPKISQAIVMDSMSSEERFQNATLRPVIKMQNALLISSFRNYINKHKNTFHQLSLVKRLLFIENAVQKDTKFRNVLKGMIIGQFTVEEYETYTQDSSSLNKRMMHMVMERLKDQVQLLENKEALL